MFTDGTPNHRPLVYEVRAFGSSVFQCQYSVIITRKISCIRVENLAMLTLWLLLTFISWVIFPFFPSFFLVVVSAARCRSLLYSAVVLVVSRSVCMSPVSGSSLWNWQSRQYSCCHFLSWQASSGVLSCSLCIEPQLEQTAKP